MIRQNRDARYSVSDILLRLGIRHKYATERAERRARAKAIARKQGKAFNKADRRALEQEKQGEDKEKTA